MQFDCILKGHNKKYGVVEPTRELSRREEEWFRYGKIEIERGKCTKTNQRKIVNRISN